MGSILQRRGDFGGALRSFEDGAKICEEHSAAVDGSALAYRIFISLGNLHFRMDNIERAMEAYTVAARMYNGASSNTTALAVYALIIRSSMDSSAAGAA